MARRARSHRKCATTPRRCRPRTSSGLLPRLSTRVIRIAGARHTVPADDQPDWRQQMTFPISASRLRFGDSYAHALEDWRHAADVASGFWHEYERAGRDFQPLVFGAYLVALDAEE